MSRKPAKIESEGLTKIHGGGPVIVSYYETSETGRVWKDGWDYYYDETTPFWQWKHEIVVDGVKVE